MKKIFTLLLLTISLLQAVAFVVPVNPSQRQFRVSSSLSTLPTRTQVADESGITVTYNFSALSVVPDSMLYPDSYFWGFQGWFNTPVAGTPSLPETHDLFLLPPGASDISVEVLENEAYTHPYKPTPGRILLFDESRNNYTYDDNVPPIDNNLLPQTYTPVCIEYIGKKRNDVLVAITVNPIHYDPAESNIQVSSILSYRLKYNLQDFSPQRSRGSIEIGLPKDTITPYPPYPPGILQEMWKWEQALAATNDSTLREADDYLIISTPKYVTSLHNFVQWKRECGHKVQLLYRYDWTPDLIKSEINNAYANNPFLKYVVFAGSIEEIPSVVIQKAAIPSDDDITPYTDFFYCNLRSQDDVSANPSQESDRVRDLFSGRFFASSSTEMNTICSKIINYEKKGVKDKTFYNRAFHVGFFEDGYPYTQVKANGDTILPTPSNGIDDNRFIMTSEEVRSYVISKNKTIERQYTMWPYRTDSIYNWQPPAYWRNSFGRPSDTTPIPLPEDLKYPNFWYSHNAATISQSFNKGAFYILELTHGSINCWENPCYTTNDISKLTNGDKLPIVFNLGCSCGEFKAPNSFAKALLKQPNGGAVGAIAFSNPAWCDMAFATAIGFFNTIWPSPGVASTLNYTSGSPNYPNIDFSYTKDIAEDRLTLGRILEGGILQCWKIYGLSKNEGNPYSGSYRRTIIGHNYISHIFGDPGMLFPTEAVEPIPEDSVSVTYTISPDMFIADKSHKMIINISLPFEAKIGLYNKTTGKIERYYGKRASIYAPSTKHEYVLSVVKANRLPFFLNITESTPKSGANAVLPQLTSASQQPGNASVDITVDFQDCMTEHAEVTISDMYGNNIGNSVVSPDENSCSVKITQPTTGIGLVTLSVDGTVIDATKINIVK